MPDVGPPWAKILSFTVHEFRTPLTVVGGYIRMLLKDRAITDQQRRILGEAEKSYGRLKTLVDELSELSRLESRNLTFNRQRTDVRAAIRAAADEVPPLPDRDVPIALELGEGPAMIDGDPVRLAQAFGALIAALRREIITEEPLTLREETRDGGPLEFHVGDRDALAVLGRLAADGDQPIFDEWRGGAGLSLVIAHRIIEEHGGRLVGAPEGTRAGAVVFLPSS